MPLIPDLMLSCWVVEAAHAAVLEFRGHSAPAVRSAERARVIASACAREGIKIVPRWAGEHGAWMRQVAGANEDTGLLGWFFLQRLGKYVEAHLKDQISEKDYNRLVELAAEDEQDVQEAIATAGMPEVPPGEWPQTAFARAPGKVIGEFGILADPHVAPDDPNDLVVNGLQDLDAEGVKVTVAPGDLTKDGGRDAFRKTRELFDKAGGEILLTLGNHDMGGMEVEPVPGTQAFEETFGRGPCAIWEDAGMRIIALNSADPSASPFPPFSLLEGDFTSLPRNTVPGGALSAETLEWMAGIESSDAPTFIVLHHPPFPYLGFPPLVFGLDRASTGPLQTFVERVDAQAIFCGHTHRSALTYLGDTPVIEVPSVKEWPYGYGVVTVTDRSWAFNLKPVSKPPEQPANDPAGYIFRRYARGPDEARAFRGDLS